MLLLLQLIVSYLILSVDTTLQVSVSVMIGACKSADSAAGSYSGNLYLHFASKMNTMIPIDTIAPLRLKT